MTAAKDRLFRLARAIESDVIPRLVQAHRASETLRPAAAKPSAADVQAFVADIVGDREDAVTADRFCGNVHQAPRLSGGHLVTRGRKQIREAELSRA